MEKVFFIVGPTGVGKSELAAEVAASLNGEIVGADAFQIYGGLDLLTGKPDAATLGRVPHHLISTTSVAEPMNAERFRAAAACAIADIHSRGKQAFVVGGSGMYVHALTHGLSPLPAADPELRVELAKQTTAELLAQLRGLDPETAAKIDGQNRHRIVRALEICVLSGRPAAELRNRTEPTQQPQGVLISRDRAELNERIDQRVIGMFREGVLAEVQAAREPGVTAHKTLGLRQIRDLIEGYISEAECIAQIQQATRRYAKRQLTWFRRQTTFEPLNLSHHDSSEAIEWISRKARLSFTPTDD